MNWNQGEPGPQCHCGWPTIVASAGDGRFVLMCLWHTKPEGACWPLPAGGRPDHWPNLSDGEMQALIEKGVDEEKEIENDDD